MTVQAIYKHWNIRCVSINQFFRRQFRVGPAFVIPIAPRDPPSGWQLCGEVANSLGEFLWRVGVAQINTRKLKAAAHEMHMRVVETRQQKLTLRVDHARVGAGEIPDFFGRSHGDNAIALDRDSFGARTALIHRVHPGVNDDQVHSQ